MKLTDVFAKYIKQLGIKQVFGLQGGAVVHFFDSLEKFNVNVTYNHHEESSALFCSLSSAPACASKSNSMEFSFLLIGTSQCSLTTGMVNKTGPVFS